MNKATKWEKNGYWFSTENGTHIHAEEGQTPKEAVEERFDNDTKKQVGDSKNLEKEGKTTDTKDVEEYFGKGSKILYQENNAFIGKYRAFGTDNNYGLAYKDKNGKFHWIFDIADDDEPEEDALKYMKSKLSKFFKNPRYFERHGADLSFLDDEEGFKK